MKALWAYMQERARIYKYKELEKSMWPWTHDEILQKYKFTNVKREWDRTTKEFLKIYKPKNKELLLYNCAVFRYFGTSEFAHALGWQKHYDPEWIRKVAAQRMHDGQRVFTGAYVITNSGQTGPKENVVTGYLEQLVTELPAIVKALNTGEWKAGYYKLRQMPGFGGSGFMAKEVLQDYLLVRTAAGEKFYDYYNWTPIGPGARRGLNRLLKRPLNYTQVEELFINECIVLWRQLSEKWDKFCEWAGPLTAHDVQFCLCEFDKYERVRLGEGRPRSLYKLGA